MPRILRCRAFSLTCLVAALLLVPALAHALQVTGIDCRNKNGQTFITWNNLPGTGWTYHVYASQIAVRTGTDFFANAWELGSVGDSSAVDRRITQLLGATTTFSVDSGAAPLNPRRGLFVVTPPGPGIMHYVILAESALYPLDYHFYPGQNTTEYPVIEQYAVPRPVWQQHITYPRCEHYVLWAGSNDIPGFPAMWAKENHALHFGVVPGKVGGALILRGHGRGHSFFSGVTTTGRAGETVIAPDDWLETWDVASFFLGYNNTYDPNVGNNPYAAPGATVMDYTDRFVMYLLDWGQANFGPDRNRTYALGQSMGGSFAYFLAWHHSDRIAASMCVVPKVCARYFGDTSPTIMATFERMWSPVNVDLPTIEGVPVFDWMDGRSLAQRYRRRGSAPIIAFAGRQDVIVSWEEKPRLFEALQANQAGETWFWDNREHSVPSWQVTWEPEMLDEQQLYRYRLDLSYPALSNCTADSDPGDGSPTSGDIVGTMNGFVQWDEELVDTRDRWEVVLRPHTLHTRDGDLQPPSAIATDVTPRRLQKFLVTDRTSYRYTVEDVVTGEPLASGVLNCDGEYLLTVPQVPVSPNGSRLSIQALSSLDVTDGRAPRTPRVALSSNPVRNGSRLQVEWPAEGPASIDLLDLAGRRVRSLYDAPARGATSLSLDASGLAPGVYMVHARQGATSSSARVVVVR